MLRFERKEPSLLYILDWIGVLYQFIEQGNPVSMPGYSALYHMMEYHLDPDLNV